MKSENAKPSLAAAAERGQRNSTGEIAVLSFEARTPALPAVTPGNGNDSEMGQEQAAAPGQTPPPAVSKRRFFIVCVRPS